MSTGIIAIAAALAIAISTIGPGIGQGIAASKAMEAMAPAKAAVIRVRELVSRPWFRKATMTSATASLAPLEMPMTKGPAMGLAKKVCSR